jgi:ketosteroid isomerase-like protein
MRRLFLPMPTPLPHQKVSNIKKPTITSKSQQAVSFILSKQCFSNNHFLIKINFQIMKTVKCFFAVLCCTAFMSLSTAQTTTSYKDLVVENPNAEADMKVVGDYVNALVSGDLDKAKTLLAPNFMGRGPSQLDSANTEKTMANWQANYKVQSDRKVRFVTQTFKVLSGNTKGNWVSLWGAYTFTQTEKAISIPFQYTASVADGKILSDRIYFDNLSVVRQLGYKLTPPETAGK